mmetsp:Transcript_20064/g.80415  ORF Transcript_20064/g.80415 Transcript_20064/m.80415 type:complete len:115 (+) Transcript_20064:3135-3479(+)
MSFAKDILGIPKKGASSSGLPTEFAASPPQPVSRKKEGVPRELLHLGGGISSSPTIAPSVSFKEKPQQKVYERGKSTPVYWEIGYSLTNSLRACFRFRGIGKHFRTRPEQTNSS